MILKGFEIVKAHMKSSEKVLQSKCNFERKKLDTNDGCGLSWLVLKDRAKKTTKNFYCLISFINLRNLMGSWKKSFPVTT